MILRTTIIWQALERFKLQIFAVSCIVALSGCTDWLPEAHKLDLQQGNTVKLEQLEGISIGMTKSEVRKIMGSPMLSDPFHNQRWDYIYRFIPKKGFERKSLLTLYFEDDVLVKIDDSEYVEP
ncbi:MAG: outer membrane protein assembly factor BamE [Gammaproteobacteria bacterium]|nr:outer membrane protein assembly factor BamE [Gammaproteobacteria bacterium]